MPGSHARPSLIGRALEPFRVARHKEGIASVGGETPPGQPAGRQRSASTKRVICGWSAGVLAGWLGGVLAGIT
jgi:hypothetical protein